MKKAVKCILLVVVVLVFIIGIAGITHRDSIEIPRGFNGSYITVGGEKLRYIQKGKGPDVLLIHGLPGSVEDWSTILDTLAHRYRVTAYDRPGHGFSGADRAGCTLDSNAAAARRLIDALKLKNVIVAGHSYGGGVVLAMASQNFKNVRGYVFIAGVSYPIAGGEPLFGLVRIPLLGRGFAVLTSRIVGSSMLDEEAARAFRPNESQMPKDYIPTRSVIFLQPKVIVTLAREDGSMNADLASMAPRYGSISSPLVIVHGSGDLLVPPGDSRKLHETVKGSRLMMLESVGHYVQFVRPGKVIEAIDAINRTK